jgi:hypothetical protein
VSELREAVALSPYLNISENCLSVDPSTVACLAGITKGISAFWKMLESARADLVRNYELPSPLGFHHALPVELSFVIERFNFHVQGVFMLHDSIL